MWVIGGDAGRYALMVRMPKGGREWRRGGGHGGVDPWSDRSVPCLVGAG